MALITAENSRGSALSAAATAGAAVTLATGSRARGATKLRPPPLHAKPMESEASSISAFLMMFVVGDTNLDLWSGPSCAVALRLAWRRRTAIGCCLGADDIMAGISLQRLRAIVLDSLGK